MFQAISRIIARRERPKQTPLSELSDAELVRKLKTAAEPFAYGYQNYRDLTALSGALRVLRERAHPDQLESHPNLAPIVQELAALPSEEARQYRPQALAIIRATTTNPWRTLFDASKSKQLNPA